MDISAFDDIKTALKGQTVLPEPRVSRETIISVLKTHTELIMGLRKDHINLVEKVSDVDQRTAANRISITKLEEENKLLKSDINKLFRLSDEFRQEMDELSQKVTELFALKKELKEQKEQLDSITNKFTIFSAEVSNFMDKTTSEITYVVKTCNDTVFQLKEMKDYVDHFADNLILNSQQILVDTSAGFSTKPLPLTDVLRLCTNNFDDIQKISQQHESHLNKVDSELETKAPDSVLFNVTNLEKKVATIELHIKKEEEQGLGALRKLCEELSVHVQSMSAELSEKIDRDSVGFIVHEKYEEIVKYLQDALQSSLEDENNFKEKADEIQEMVILLSNSKADRTEIANMQEIMVKSEAMMKKIGTQNHSKEKMKDYITKKELDALLSMKVDKLDFEQQISQVVSNTKRSKRLSSFSTSLGPVNDEAMNPTMQSVQESSSSPQYQTRPHSSGGFSSKVVSNQTVVPTGVPVIALGQGLGSPSSKRQVDFASFMKGKGKGGSKLMSNSMGSLPNGEVPGAFRKATEGGLPGGAIDPSNKDNNLAGYGPSEYPYSDSVYPLNYTEQSSVTDQLAYLHGPIVGGGFNARTAHILRSLPGGNSIPGDDVEGKGLMLKGSDGSLYYKDLNSEGSKATKALV